MRFSETLRGVIILGFGFGPPFCIIWFLFERLETLVKDGNNPTIQLATLFQNMNFGDWIIIKSIRGLTTSVQIFQWDSIQNILSWIQSSAYFMINWPVELWVLASWPILNWIGYRLTKFIKKI
jgi:hypothetical protein